MRPRIRARLARRPNPTRHTAPRAHGACLAAALAAAACMLLLLPPSDSYAAGDGLRGPFKNAMGPSPFYRNLSHEPHLAPSPRSDPAAPSGWHPQTQREDVPEKYKITCLNHLTIRRLTYHFTQPLIGDKRPNCEEAWNERCGQRSLIPFHLIWPSLGTPLSDATEENAWRKLLHRGIFVRNRDPKLPSHNCRLGCGRIESMRHTANCPRMKPFWDEIFKFISTVMRVNAPPLREKAIIFNEWKRN